MDNSLLIGLSRQAALRRELDVVANNIANIGTNGYKSQRMAFQEYVMPVARSDDFPRSDRRLSYVQDRGTWQDFKTGPMQVTDNPLDMAINGSGFFVIDTPQGERYTRDGSFQVNTAGQLVTASGAPVMTTEGVLQLAENETDLSIGADGTITTNAGARGRIRLVDVPNPQNLTSDGSNLFQSPTPVAEMGAGEVRLEQGALEKSNVEPVLEISRMMELTRSYQSISSLMQRSEQMRSTAIERLSDIPA
ncbi:flagellar basal-body rod protein FlgF [Agaricicola taiwanensis]|uniref:Flagellar basal-body rod protein FlgF n=1 Tax=Agaricicola taiwanensis TaxID=591372 RepID=A0A8J2VYI8_9RHOB|nr:flagellar basal-body rod protein FlgF [Agaricicola taiwanensis]GGE40635.1 flagellar basal-body rod protein FlgF [Agaricicola taiwanensis]